MSCSLWVAQACRRETAALAVREWGATAEVGYCRITSLVRRMCNCFPIAGSNGEASKHKARSSPLDSQVSKTTQPTQREEGSPSPWLTIG